MTNSELALKLKERFAKQTVIKTSEISEVLSSAFVDLSANTISWRINQLKKEKFIHQVGRGLYSFDFRPKYTPELSLKSKRLFNRVKPLCKGETCIWDTILLNEIAGVNINRYWAFISVPKDELEPLFKEMLDFSKQVFLQPDKEVISRYLIPQLEAIILTPLVSETPLIRTGEYTTPSLEGILVNAWLENDNILQPIGLDAKVITKRAFNKWNVNQSKLLRYAARRDKRDEIGEFIKTLI